MLSLVALCRPPPAVHCDVCALTSTVMDAAPPRHLLVMHLRSYVTVARESFYIAGQPGALLYLACKRIEVNRALVVR